MTEDIKSLVERRHLQRGANPAPVVESPPTARQLPPLLPRTALSNMNHWRCGKNLQALLVAAARPRRAAAV
jgi:hypothetical protein